MSEYHIDSDAIKIRSNWLTVHGSTLRANVLEFPSREKMPVSADELERILTIGRTAIVAGIEEFYYQIVQKNPGLKIARPSIYAAHLGTEVQTDGRGSEVFTEAGYNNGGINQSIDEIHDRFHDHWRAVEGSGFIAEVRRTSTKRDGGAWLLLRDEELS